MEEATVKIIPAEAEDFYGKEDELSQVVYMDVCPECGMNSLTRAGRCSTCSFCGWSACSL